MKQYLSIEDIVDVDVLIQEALEYKSQPFKHQQLGEKKSLLLLFANPSLRTRLSTEKAGRNLGLNVTTMDLSGGWNLEYEDGVTMNENKAEHIREAAQVVSQYADIIGFRSFPTLVDRSKDYADFAINQLSTYASRPIVNMESAIAHPLQALTDAITIQEKAKDKAVKVVLSWAPHPKALPQAVANSFVKMMKKRPVNLVITHPEGMDLSPEITEGVTVMHNQSEACDQADFVYTKNWSSYSNYGQSAFLPDWTIDEKLLSITNNAHFMHCLPVRRNVVVSDEVLNSQNSLVINQANNRTYAAQAVLARILKSL